MNPRALAIALCGALLAVSVWFVLARIGAGPVGPRPPEAGGAGATATARHAAGPGRTEADPADGEPAGGEDSRQSLAPAVLGAPPGVRALVGLAVADDGAPLAGAEVHAMPTFAWSVDPSAWQQDVDWTDRDQVRETFRRMRAGRTRARSAADGTFRIPIPAEARAVDVYGQLAGWQVAQLAQILIPSTGDVDIGRLGFAPGAVVRGKVVDAEERPVEGALVMRTDPGAQPEPGFDQGLFDESFELSVETGIARTGSDGGFELLHLPPGPVVVTALHRDRPPVRSEVLDLAAGGEVDGLRLIIGEGAGIRGRVVGLPGEDHGAFGVGAVLVPSPGEEDAAAGGIEDLKVLLAFGGSPFVGGEVGADGAFELRGLQPGRRYRMFAWAPGGGASLRRVCSDLVEVPAGSAGVELRYEAGVVVRLQVVDAERGTAVERMVVRHASPGGQSPLDWIGMQNLRPRDYPGGVVTIAGLSPADGATFQVMIDAAGYRPFVREGITLPLSGELDLGTVRLEAAPTVRVEVLAADGRSPLAGASVRLLIEGEEHAAMPFLFPGMSGSGAAGKTRDDGRCTLSASAGAEVRVEVRHPEHAPHRSEVLRVPALGGLEHRVAMLVGGTVEVLAADETGAEPLAMAAVEWRDPDGGQSARAADARGRAVFEHLRPGPHRFRVGRTRGGMHEVFDLLGSSGEPQAGTDGWEEVAVADASTTTIRLRKAPTARVRGVVRENGLALGGASLTFVPADGGEEAGPVPVTLGEWIDVHSGPSAESDAEGRYEIEGLDAGDHLVTVTHPGRQMAARRSARLALGDNRVDLDLDSATLGVLVLDPERRPVAGARVAVVRAPDGVAPVPDPSAVAGGAETDARGACDARGVEPDVDLLVVVEHPMFVQGRSTRVRVGPGGRRDGVEVLLERGGALELRFAPPGEGIHVLARPVGGSGGQKWGQPGPDGLLRFEGMRAGEWRVEVHAEDRDEPQARTVLVEVGKTTRADF